MSFWPLPMTTSIANYVLLENAHKSVCIGSLVPRPSHVFQRFMRKIRKAWSIMWCNDDVWTLFGMLFENLRPLAHANICTYCMYYTIQYSLLASQRSTSELLAKGDWQVSRRQNGYRGSLWSTWNLRRVPESGLEKHVIVVLATQSFWIWILWQRRDRRHLYSHRLSCSLGRLRK